MLSVRRFVSKSQRVVASQFVELFAIQRQQLRFQIPESKPLH